MSRAEALYTLVKHLEKIQDGTARFCADCPIAGTEYCHKLNPKAPRYTRFEKIEIRKQLDKGANEY